MTKEEKRDFTWFGPKTTGKGVIGWSLRRPDEKLQIDLHMSKKSSIFADKLKIN